MKTAIEDYGNVVVQLSAKDIAKLIKCFYHETDEEYITIFNASTEDFVTQDIGLRQHLLQALVKKHYSKAAAKKVIEVMDSFDTSMFE